MGKARRLREKRGSEFLLFGSQRNIAEARPMQADDNPILDGKQKRRCSPHLSNFLNGLGLNRVQEDLEVLGLYTFKDIVGLDDWNACKDMGRELKLDIGDMLRLSSAVGMTRRSMEKQMLEVEDSVGGENRASLIENIRENSLAGSRSDMDEWEEGRKSGCCWCLYGMVPIIYRFGTAFDLFLPVDHQCRFIAELIRVKPDWEIKQFVYSFCELWIVVYSLVLGAVLALHPLFPVDEVSMTKIVLWETLHMSASVFSFLTIIGNGILFVNFSAVDSSNAKAYVASVLPSFMLMNYILALSGYSTLFMLLYLGYIRVSLLGDEYEYVAVLLTLVCGVMSLFVVVSMNVASLLALESGFMARKGDAPAVTGATHGDDAIKWVQSNHRLGCDALLGSLHARRQSGLSGATSKVTPVSPKMESKEKGNTHS